MIDAVGPNPASITATLERSMRAANRAVGRDLAATVRKANNAAIKGTGRSTLSGMRVTLGVRTKVFAGAERVTIDVTANPAGPWSIREHGRGAVKARGRALGIPGYPRRSARAAPGRATWNQALEGAAPRIEQAIRDVYDETLET